LVYINRGAVTPSKPKEEYVYRMNMGIQDAIEKGVPEGYVEEVMRKYIPEMEEVGEVVEVAKRQATESGNER
jgi:gamma-glutamylcyclotransferase